MSCVWPPEPPPSGVSGPAFPTVSCVWPPDPLHPGSRGLLSPPCPACGPLSPLRSVSWGLLSPPCPACGPLSPLHSGSRGLLSPLCPACGPLTHSVRGRGACCGALSLPHPGASPGRPQRVCGGEGRLLSVSLSEPRQDAALCSQAACTDSFPELKKKKKNY